MTRNRLYRSNLSMSYEACEAPKQVRAPSRFPTSRSGVIRKARNFYIKLKRPTQVNRGICRSTVVVDASRKQDGATQAHIPTTPSHATTSILRQQGIPKR